MASRARDELTIARDLLTAANHGDRAFAEHNLGIALAASGDHHLALTHFERAAAVYTSTIGDQSAAAIRLLVDRASSETLLGDADTGRAHATAARTAAQAAGIQWIVDEADAILRGVTVERGTRARRGDGPIEPPPVTQVLPAAPEERAPTQPAPKRDVGVYGAAQPW